jgi:hypothetical protein
VDVIRCLVLESTQTGYEGVEGRKERGLAEFQGDNSKEAQKVGKQG